MSRLTLILLTTLVMLGLLGCGDEPAAVMEPAEEPAVVPTATPEEIAEARGRLLTLYHMAGAWMHAHREAPKALADVLPPPAEGEALVIPKDPWGREYEIVLEDEKYWIRTLGPDGKADTEDDLTHPLRD